VKIIRCGVDKVPCGCYAGYIMERTFIVFNAKDCTETELSETETISLFGQGAMLLGRTYKDGVYYGIYENHLDSRLPYGGPCGNLIHNYCGNPVGGKRLKVDVK
jgi:hypothetical protein